MVRSPVSIEKGGSDTQIPQRPVLFVANTCEVVCALGALSPSPVSMWTNSPSRHEPLLLHAFGRSEGLFGSPS